MHLPLRSLWKFYSRKDIKAQKLTTVTSDPTTILGTWTRGTFDNGKDRLNGLVAKWLNAD